MSTGDLFKKAIKYGIDEEGVRDRFAGNTELFERCFSEFLTEQNHKVLSDALRAKDYTKAFESAHALKGLSGNLGLTAYYEAICVLVESLRAHRLEHIADEYRAVQTQYDMIMRAFTGKPVHEKHKNKSNPHRSLIIVFAAVFIVCVLFISFFFYGINVDYNRNILAESGQHLSRTANEIRLYIDGYIDNDWKIAESVGERLSSGELTNDTDIMDMMKRKQDIWEVTDLMLLTEKGYCVYTNGRTISNDIASGLIAKAREHGRYISVVKSEITYTVPLETEVEYRGSRIAAVSVVRNMASFLDDMDFSAYDNSAWMYLANNNGEVISMLSSPSAPQTYNISVLTEGADATPLFDSKNGSTPQTMAYLMQYEGQEYYLVTAPISTGTQWPFKMLFIESQTVVNNSMNGFSIKLTVFSIAMIVLFSIFAFLMFMYMYIIRKRAFDKAITTRDHILDLLVKNTGMAFALFNVADDSPSFVSANMPDIIGDLGWTLIRKNGGYRLKNSTVNESEALMIANEALLEWDGKSPFRSDYIRNTRNGMIRFFEYQLYPVDGDGDSFIGIAQDMTPVYMREQTIKDAMEMAKRSNEAKSRFLSSMSHDIRTPMNVIMNMTNFALESIDQPKKLGVYLRTIHESSQHLLHLINDVLDMSRIESGKTAVVFEPFNLKAEIQRQADMIKPLCASRSQRFITDFNGIQTENVCGDALKLSQIIMNLLSNAVKFTPQKGAIRFTAREITSLRDELINVRFTIEDNGIGISPENINRIFEPFCRANDRKVSKIEGTGLGLSICKSYVEAMGGTINCISEEGEGSTFTVELFFHKAETRPKEYEARAYSSTMYSGMRCLVVEDNQINQMIAKELLERLGFMVDFADDGAMGLDKFSKSAADTYDVIYMDIQMPIMDGYQTTIAIRSSNHPRAKTVPIIAMTANAFAEDIEKARVAGMDAYISKPIVSFDLIEQTDKALSRRRSIL